MPWSQLLENFAAAIADAEAVAAAADSEGSGGEVAPPDAGRTWAPPRATPATPPTDEDLARFAELEARASACRERLEAAMSATVRDLDEVRVRRHAGRRYGSFAAGSSEEPAGRVRTRGTETSDPVA